MKKIIVLVLGLSLAACATKNPFTKPTLGTIEATYGVALSIAVPYRAACNAKSIPSSCRAIVAKIQQADNYAYGQLVVARNFVKNNPTVDATTILLTAQAAVDAFNAAAQGAK